MSDKDTISRQATIDTEGLDVQIRCEMCRNPMHTDRGCDGNCKYDEKLYERIMQILGERIKPLPSAQSERRKGRWIKGVCSECGYDWLKDAPISSVSNFCPNCGAEMRDKQDIYYKEIIEESPTIDFTICKYCKYHIQEGEYWYCNVWQRETKKDWACSRGKGSNI